ncbi:AMIN domain-containing protein [bacterium]|nr:AMIN domain-containing protein [bacterium]MBU1883951.1 AMIN domain-containing protein [bacterium]
MSLILWLDARENPFFPSDDSQNLFISTNQVQQHEQLSRAALTLPSSARILREVSVEYVNLDGSVERKSISLDNAVDWHLPIFVSQSYTNDAPMQQKTMAVKPTEKMSDTAVKNTVAPVKKSPPVKNDDTFHPIANYDFIAFLSKYNTMKIVTEDNSIRDFMLVDPYRIIIDFKEDYDFKSLQQDIKDSVFTKIRVGNHDGYYRVVIELDGQYKYDLKKDKDGYILHCY